MAEIKLLRGEVALVDEEDVPRLSGYAWRLHSNGYVVASTRSWRDGSYRLVYMHRFILNAPNGAKVDHEDRNRLNNQRYNIRLATSVQNAWNRPSPSISKTSAFKGVFWYALKRKWQATITANGKKTYIGRFDSEVEAATAYNEVAKRLFGEFAQLNQV